MSNQATQPKSSPPTPQIPLIAADPWLAPYADALARRLKRADFARQRLAGDRPLAEFALGHLHFGLHRTADGWVFRDWAPNCISVHLIGDFNDWQPTDAYACSRLNEAGEWELNLPADALKHGDHYKLLMTWPGGSGERLPAWCRRAVQDEHSKIFTAQVWAPESSYVWQHAPVDVPAGPRVYEAHVGMAAEEGRVGSYLEFRDNVLPQIKAAGYNVVQLMAIQEHPYYGSFGYHVSNFFAPSSRFGTPEELKSLVDSAHGMGIAVIMDLVHSHAVKNELEGISRYDGTTYQYFHDGHRGDHVAWDSRCFNYGKDEVVHFLLSNCRYWLDEFRFDGYRFDGVTSMCYLDHGLGKHFAGYADYFDDNVDVDAIAYLTLANEVIHQVRPGAGTVAEDVSGMPGLAAPRDHGGVGFDYRLAMGTPDYWIKLIKERSDDQWDVGNLWYELTNRRADEKVIGYAESHDQALVGDKTIIFRLIDAEMYTHMSVFHDSLVVDRGIALHKLIRLITMATAGNGYLNFMGNEFGHPEWIDFPREGNNWSYHYARRQWSLRDDTNLRYRFLSEFDKAMMALAERFGILAGGFPHHLYDHGDDKVLAFQRGPLTFVFNFHPNSSWSGYPIPVQPGRYVAESCSDWPEFGGHDRVAKDQEWFTRTDRHGRNVIQLYLPNRTVLVLRNTDPDQE